MALVLCLGYLFKEMLLVIIAAERERERERLKGRQIPNIPVSVKPPSASLASM
jgi:hypothetical protein